jgi:hypothetical protein
MDRYRLAQLSNMNHVGNGAKDNPSKDFGTVKMGPKQDTRTKTLQVV